MLKDSLKLIWYRLARWACRILCMLCFRLRVYGRENIPRSGAFLLVSNHQSYLDPIFCGVAMKRHLFFLARDSLFTNPWFGRLISSLNSIPVKRSQANLATIKLVLAKLKTGRGVCLFPEATRTTDGRIAPFKPGFGLLGRKGNAPVVPVMIEGAFECWPRQKKIFSSGPITVRYGRPISAARVKQLNDQQLARDVTRIIRQMQNDLRKKQGKNPYNYPGFPE